MGGQQVTCNTEVHLNGFPYFSLPRMRFLFHLSLLLIIGASSHVLHAQGGKTFLKEGDAYRKDGDLVKALEKYDLAISVDPAFIKAYQARAEVNVLLGNKAMVAADRGKLAELDPADADLVASAAKAYMEIDSIPKAKELCDRALLIDRKNMEALQTLTRACLAMGDLDCASTASDAALALKGTTDTYYLHGLVRAAVRDYNTAESDLDRVLEWNHMYEPAYVALAEVQLKLYEQYSGPTMQMRALEKAIDKCTLALDLNPQSTDALFTRSKAYALQKEYAKAIDDISRCIALGRTDNAVYHQRALYYGGYGQHQNAVNDLNRIILDDPTSVADLLLRAQNREANLNMEGALKDLSLAQRAMQDKGTYEAADFARLDETRTRIAAQVFEMNRESDPPRLTVVEPFSEDGVAKVSASLNYLKVSGHVLDKSMMKDITVNGNPVDFDKEEKDPQFYSSIAWGPEDKEIVVQAVDIYDNLSSTVLTVDRTEGQPPGVAVTSPIASASRVVTIPADKESLFVEGKVTDESPIRSIQVNGVNASYPPDRNDPEFSIKVDVKDKDRFTVHAEDQFGNATEVMYTLVRAAAPVVAVTPVVKPVTSSANTSSTGVTWLVHIDNSNYRNFPAIQGGSDAGKMQKAFANYAVQRTVSKKNMSKEQMERFFNVELRDLVRSSKVNTILVWYSGHGRSTSGKAYWVPVDARKDDIYSYFNYGSLKAQMQNYSESVGNTVVVSDAAGTDASFYELTR
jgi:tetratricopeptide (TPR) repeat protein